MRAVHARLAVLVGSVALVAAACGGDDATPTTGAPAADPTPTTQAPTTTLPPAPTTTVAAAPVLTLDLSGFPALEGGFHYEGWAIIDGEPVTTGKFNIENGAVVTLEGTEMDMFDVAADLASATAIVITIEPAGDTDTLPADTHIAAGDVVDGTAELSIAHPAALGTDFSDAAGTYVLATPSTDTASDELSGVWFLSLPGPEASLLLPALPTGWKYEGWGVVEGTPLTTGKFVDVAAADESSPFGGPGRMPPFPGEDFVANAPEGVTLPTDLSGATIVISVESDPDDSDAPFALKPLVGQVPENAEPEPTSYSLELNIGDLPSGTAIIG